MSRDLRLVSISLLAWGFGEALFFYLIPLYLAELGADPAWIGGILGLAGLAMMLTHIPAGALADRLGSRKLMIAGWASGLLAAVLMFVSRSLVPFVGGLLLYHFTSFVMAPLNRYITAARQHWSTARALTSVSAMFNLGGVVGAAAGGLIAEHLGTRANFGLASLAFLFSSLMVLLTREHPLQENRSRRPALGLLRSSAFSRVTGLAFFSMFALYLSWPLTPNYLRQVHQVPLTQIGLFGALNALGMVILNLTLGGANALSGLLASQLLVAASILALWQGSAAVWFGMGYFLAGGFRVARNLILALSEQVAPPDRLGAAYGLMETAGALSLVLAPPVAGLLFQRHPALPYPASLILIACAMFFAARFQQRSSPQAPQPPDPANRR